MVSYILAVNPQILGVTGGTCDPEELCSDKSYRLLGHDCLFDPENEEAAQCLSTLRLSLTTATAASSLIACFIMGFFANLPLALAPGMGINIYFAYQVVGQDLLTYQQAMVAIFLEGWIFIFISVTGIRGGIIRLMPKNIAFASSVGIGLLLAFSGLRNLGIIVFDGNTLVTLGGCPIENQQYTITTNAPLDLSALKETTFNSTSDIIIESNAAVYSCLGGEMRSATMWLGIAGGLLMAGLTAAHVRGSFFLGIAFITVISWIPGQATSYLGEGSDIPGGQVRYELFKQVVKVPSLEGIALAWDWSGVSSGHFWVVMFTFLYIDLLDCTGTLLSMATLLDDYMEQDAEEDGKLEVYEPFLNASKEFEGQQWAFLSDGLGIVAGSLMGITPLAVFIESAAGIEDGGRTGVTAIVVAFFFFISLFFSPILASIPLYATGPALILVGVLLIAHVDRIAWDDTLESIPAFLTVIIMPFTLSVAYGVIAGIASYLALHIPIWLWKWLKGKIAEFKKKRRRRRRRKARADVAGAGGGGNGAQNGGGGNNGIGIGGLDYGNDGQDSEEESVAASISSTRSRRRIHRKVFGYEDSSKSNSFIRSPDHRSWHGDSAYPDIPDPRLRGMAMGPPSHGGGGRQGHINGGGVPLRRSSSYGSFHAPAAATGNGGGGNNGGHSVHGASAAGMMIGTSKPRGMPRSMSHAAYGGMNGGSGYSSRNGSYEGQEGILASSFAGTGGGQFSPMRGYPVAGSNYNISTGRSLSRAFSSPNAGGIGGSSGRLASTSENGGGGSGGSGASPSSFQLFPTDTSITIEGEGEHTTTTNDNHHHNLQAMPAATSRGESPQAPSPFTAPSGAGGNSSGGDTGLGLFGATDDTSLLFGGKLLSLDLESDAADVIAEKNRGKVTEPRDDSTGVVDTKTRMSLPIMPADGSSSMEHQKSLVLSSPDRVDLDEIPSVDLRAFKVGLAPTPFISRKETAGSGSSGGDEQTDHEESDIGDKSYLASLPAEQGITIHKSVSGKGSISFGQKVNDVEAEQTAAAAVAAVSAADSRDIETGFGRSTIRVEGWPSSSEPSPQQDPQLLATSLATESSLQPQSNEGSGRGMKRVESAAALRLRGLFTTGDDEVSNSGSDALEGSQREGSNATNVMYTARLV